MASAAKTGPDHKQTLNRRSVRSKLIRQFEEWRRRAAAGTRGGTSCSSPSPPRSAGKYGQVAPRAIGTLTRLPDSPSRPQGAAEGWGSRSDHHTHTGRVPSIVMVRTPGFTAGNGGQARKTNTEPPDGRGSMTGRSPGGCRVAQGSHRNARGRTCQSSKPVRPFAGRVSSMSATVRFDCVFVKPMSSSFTAASRDCER
jgi:hypothetical protein